ncbi:MAG: cobalamin biosynthesis protein [Sulfolobales archaeon]
MLWLSFYEFLAVLLLAHLMDLLYPYHRGFMLRIHPVHTAYVMALKIGRPYSSRARGVVTWFLVVSSHMIFYAFLLQISQMNTILFILVSAYVLKTSFSIKLLLDIVGRVGSCLETDDIECARYWAQQIVRRDTRELGRAHIASASIESLAESLVDGYISPLFYFLFLGPLGALFQRLVNTLDSALGYKNIEFRDVGWFSAKADTMVNYLPARITAILIVLLTPIAGGEIGRAFRILVRDRRKTESINAGYPISAIAGALGVALEKIGYYKINEDARYPDKNDIDRALKIARIAVLTWLVVVVIARSLYL